MNRTFEYVVLDVSLDNEDGRNGMHVQVPGERNQYTPINKLGEQGWELLQIITPYVQHPNGWIAVFKREVSHE